jgi:glycosyltransferase involved in cell wall biosynthesis
VVHPWLLSETVQEMASKVITFLKGENAPDLTAGFANSRQTRTWDATLTGWEREITKLADAPCPATSTGNDERRVIVVDVTNSSRDPANPGVIRVARRLSAMLQQRSELELVFVEWNADARTYAFLDETKRRFLHTYAGPTDGLGLLARYRPDLSVARFIESLTIGRSLRPVLFMPETLLDGQASARIDWARQLGAKTAAILFDLIPIFHADLCGANITQVFPQYLEALTKADAVWPISQFTLDEFRRYVAQNSLPMPAVAEAIILPGQFGERARNTSEASANGEFRILCVSTLEPRKNHLRLLSAFEALRKNRPDLPLRLILVGNRYAGAPEIAEQVESACKRNTLIEWHGVVDDSRLAQEYARASFTVYPSLVEGFGLPILESIWMGRPCVTHCGGVMQELASGGGCITVDMTDTKQIGRGLERIASDRALLADLSLQAKSRHVTTWEEYGEDVGNRLLALGGSGESR